MFHMTRRDRLARIQREGLVPGRPVLFTRSGGHVRETHDLIYGRRPVYLSDEPWFTRADYDLLAEYGNPADFALLEVDVAGLRLVADIPSLVDKGAYLEEDHLWFEEDDHPLRRFQDADGVIPYRTLFTNPAAIRAAHAWTGTAAYPDRIAPERLRQLR